MRSLRVLHYFAVAGLVSVILLLIYASVQQVYRTSLNDPQIQMARDAASKLSQGRSIESIIIRDSIEMSSSLSPFIILYDKDGKVIFSNAFLNGKMPQIPRGLFDVVKDKEEHTVSWQPTEHIRMAMVIVKTNNPAAQFVAVGRSMIEVESRIKQMRTMVFFAWLICMIVIIITASLNHFMSYKNILQKTR